MARNRTPNPPIGECPCPFKGCERTATVHRYRAQTDDPAKQRRAGRLYLRCTDHGMAHDQEWILENAVIDTAADHAAGAEAPDVEPEPAPEPPADPAPGPDPDIEADPEPTPPPRHPDPDASDDAWGIW